MSKAALDAFYIRWTRSIHPSIRQAHHVVEVGALSDGAVDLVGQLGLGQRIDVGFSRAALKRIAEDYGRSKALEGLRQAANDTVQRLDNKAGVAQALDAALRGNGLVGFYEIARRYGSVFRKILKRGRVKNETEYYLVHGALADCASSLADDERAELARVIAGFESASVGKRL